MRDIQHFLHFTAYINFIFKPEYVGFACWINIEAFHICRLSPKESRHLDLKIFAGHSAV